MNGACNGRQEWGEVAYWDPTVLLPWSPMCHLSSHWLEKAPSCWLPRVCACLPSALMRGQVQSTVLQYCYINLCTLKVQKSLVTPSLLATVVTRSVWPSLPAMGTTWGPWQLMGLPTAWVWSIPDSSSQHHCNLYHVQSFVMYSCLDGWVNDLTE